MQILIVGQGISGTNLAAEALRRGISIRVIDHPKKDTPSKTAAGMFNPVTFRVPTLSKNAREYFSVLNQFYTNMENETGTRFYQPMPYTRLFSSPEEQNNWIHKCAQGAFREFASDEIHQYSTPISAPLGGAEVFSAGFVESRKMLAGFKEKLLQDNLLIEECFNFDRLKIHENKVCYQTQKEILEADYIIFADGPQVMRNPLFNFLPFRPVKGEVLTLKIKDFVPERILSKGMFLIPKGNDLFYAGSTYSHKSLNTNPTDDDKQKILQTIEKFIKRPIEIIEHRAGIRPATKDRNALIGKHPKYPRAALFNGMGSKAVSMTPLLASVLLNHLEFGTVIDKTVDLNRFVKS